MSTTDVAIGNTSNGAVSAHRMAQLGARLAVKGMTAAKVQEVTHAIETAAQRAALDSTEATMAAMAEAHDANLLNLAESIRQLPSAPAPGIRDVWNGTAHRNGYVSRESVLQLVASLQAVRT